MATKKTVKIDTKKEAKASIHEVVINALTQAGFTWADGASNYANMGPCSIVVKRPNGVNDVAISFTTPKPGEDTYDYKAYEEEDEEESE